MMADKADTTMDILIEGATVLTAEQDHPVIDGRVVVEDSRATLVDQDDIRLQADWAARQLWKRARE